MDDKILTLLKLLQYDNDLTNKVLLRREYDFTDTTKSYNSLSLENAYSKDTGLSGNVNISMPRESDYSIILYINEYSPGSKIILENTSYNASNCMTLRFKQSSLLNFNILGNIICKKIIVTEIGDPSLTITNISELKNDVGYITVDINKDNECLLFNN